MERKLVTVDRARNYYGVVVDSEEIFCRFEGHAEIESRNEEIVGGWSIIGAGRWRN